MPRPLVIGNGSLHVTFDDRLQMRDLYYPYVGMEDHTTFGGLHRVGVMDQKMGFAWMDNPNWVIHANYKHETMVTHSTAINDRLGLSMEVEDAVHPVHNILIRKFRLTTTDTTSRDVQLFFHHDFRIYGDNQKDTAFFEPHTNTVIHFRQTRYFLIGGSTTSPRDAKVARSMHANESLLHRIGTSERSGLSSFSIGKAHFNGLEGTWRDAEDGVLTENAIEQGSVDSTISIHCNVQPLRITEVYLWVCLGKSLTEVVDLHQLVVREDPQKLVTHTVNFWKSWGHQSRRCVEELPMNLQDLFVKSAQLVRLHCDNHGGIVAAADNDIMLFNRDTYTYVWPRDGAFTAVAMSRAGFHDIARRFFEFCKRIQSEDGYLMQKFNPDGSLGSSWHPWFTNGEPQLPIQEDETALVLWAINDYVAQTQDIETAQALFPTFIKKAAQFLCDYRDDETGLPLASYDPWEEHRGIFTYTVATVIAGLQSASHLSQILGHHSSSERFHTAADEMKQSLLFHFFNESLNRFIKQLQYTNHGTVEVDATIDASLCMIWKLGILPSNDPRVVSTMHAIEETLTVRTAVGGIARYTNDRYHAGSPNSKDVPGNPWIITTLWFAQWLIDLASNESELARPLDLLKWAYRHASSTGILPEQIHPITGAPLSVAPLTWSHATFVETATMYCNKARMLAS